MKVIVVVGYNRRRVDGKVVIEPETLFTGLKHTEARAVFSEARASGKFHVVEIYRNPRVSSHWHDRTSINIAKTEAPGAPEDDVQAALDRAAPKEADAKTVEPSPKSDAIKRKEPKPRKRTLKDPAKGSPAPKVDEPAPEPDESDEADAFDFPEDKS